MPYIIRDYNSNNVRLTIGDGTVNNSTSLNLIGKNVSNFGALQNENFLYLLENFSNTSPPLNSINGQLWYDTNNLNYNNQGVWNSLAVISTDQSASQPGALYLNTVSNQLYINTGTGFSLVGPEGVPGYPTTRMISTLLEGTDLSLNPVIEMTVNGEVLAVVSNNNFFVNYTNSIPGISYVNRGITFKNSTSNDVPINGVITRSYLSTTATNIAGGGTGSLPYQSSQGNTSLLPIGSTGTILTSSETGPQWTNINSISVENAVNLSGGNQGDLLYQSSSGNTSFLNLGNQNYILTAGISGPTWSNPSTISVTSSTNAVYAISAGSAGTSTYAAQSFRSYRADSISWSGVTTTPTTIAGYGITDAITPSTVANFIVNTATMVVNRIGIDNSTYGSVHGQWSLESGSTFYATYADLAEKYMPDSEYLPSTVLVFGGDEEVTISDKPMDTSVAGIISTNPAYGMNKDLEGGVYIALAGRVPCKVIGPIKKGDLLVTSKVRGVATAVANISVAGASVGSLIGKAISDYEDSLNVGIIEVMVKSN